MDPTSRPGRRIGMITALVLAVGALGVGIATGQTTGDTYTGCLKNGQLSKVAIGTEPLSACGSGSVQVSWNEKGQDGANGISAAFWGNAPTSANVDEVPPDPPYRAMVPTGPVPDGWASVISPGVLRVANSGLPLVDHDIIVDCYLRDSNVNQLTSGGGNTLLTLFEDRVLSPGQSVEATVVGVFQIDEGYVSVQCFTDNQGGAFEIARITIGGLIVTPVNQGVVGYQ